MLRYRLIWHGVRMLITLTRDQMTLEVIERESGAALDNEINP